jgi:thioesterase domain-containing protein
VLRGMVRTTRRAAYSASDDAEIGPGGWRRLLAGQPLAQRRATLLNLVRGEVAAVLGHADVNEIAPGAGFTDIGFDSLASVLLRDRLGIFTALRLPATVALELPSSEQLTEHLLSLLSDALPEPEPPPAAATPSPQRLASFYRRVCEAGKVASAMQLVLSASWALPTFDAGNSKAHALPPKRLASGPAGPALVCFPSFFPAAGLGSYGKFAPRFEGERGVFEIPYPGLAGGDAVPQDWATLVGMHAETVRRHFGDLPVVLVGHSIGGCTAHAVTARLAELGTPPAGLVLTDTYVVTEENNDQEWLLSMPVSRVLRAGTQFDELVDDTALAAMGAYNRILRSWRVSATGVPTLLLRAQDPMPEMSVGRPGHDWRASWPPPHDTVDIPGNHEELAYERVETTTAAIRSWITSRF